MINIFEVEANASQDANYREHLNRNWQNGNTEFDKLEGLLNTLEKNLNNYGDEIHQLQESFNNLKEQHTQDNEIIEEQGTRISKLEDAVFNAVYINDTDELPTDNPTTSEDINETNVIDDDNGLIIEEDKHKSLPSEVND